MNNSGNFFVDEKSNLDLLNHGFIEITNESPITNKAIQVVKVLSFTVTKEKKILHDNCTSEY